MSVKSLTRVRVRAYKENIMSENNTSTQHRRYGAGVHKTRLDYNDSTLLLEVEGLARDGFDDQQIAEILDVSAKAFSRNKIKRVPVSAENPTGESALSKSLKKGRRPLSVMIENSLFKRAIGLTVKTITSNKKILLVDGEPKEFTEVITTETELPGDVNAQSFWLKHHKPDIYNQQPVKVDLTSGGKVVKNETPRITHIEHITITDTNLKHQIEPEI
jgi:hypothetical protein